MCKKYENMQKGDVSKNNIVLVFRVHELLVYYISLGIYRYIKIASSCECMMLETAVKAHICLRGRTSSFAHVAAQNLSPSINLLRASLVLLTSLAFPCCTLQSYYILLSFFLSTFHSHHVLLRLLFLLPSLTEDPISREMIYLNFSPKKRQVESDELSWIRFNVFFQ